MGTHEKGYVNWIYKDIAPSMGNVWLRVGLLREVSKTLIHLGLSEKLRESIIMDLCGAFGMELSGQGILHFVTRY